MNASDQPQYHALFARHQADYERALLDYWGNSADGAHDLAHIRRVLKNCLDIASHERKAPDFEILLPAVIFHDLVNLPKDSPHRASASRQSAEIAGEILRSQGFTEAKIPAVKHAIEAHSFSANITPVSVEAKVLQDADRLDALGAIGLARTMYVAGSLGKELYHISDPSGADRQLNDVKFALDHFPVKLFRLADTMKTSGGASIARRRTAVLREFYQQFLKEIG